MSMCEVEDAAVLNHQVDDLLLDARGLVLVREVLARRGASRAELDAHTRELERVRRKLVEAIEGVQLGRTEENGPVTRRVDMKANLTW